MAEIKVNKADAARRQINMAIRLLFNNEDPIPIHTIAMAGFRIVRDLAEEKPGHRIEDLLAKVIKPGMEAQFWKAVNRPANFLKHADKDPDDILDDVQEELNDVTLQMASLWYQELGYELTREMKALIAWFAVLHPDMVHESSEMKPLLNRPELAYLKSESRAAQLEIGKLVLENTKK